MRVVVKREKGDAIIIKTEESKYSEVFKAMRSDAKLADLGADVRSVRRTRTGEMILELKRDKERKGAAYKSLAEEVLGKGVEVKAITPAETLKVMNLDEITDAEEHSGNSARYRCLPQPFGYRKVRQELRWP